MPRFRHTVTHLLSQGIITGTFLPPVLALAKVLQLIQVAWEWVLLPWVLTAHLVLCWFSARILAQMMWALVNSMSRWR